MLSNEKNTTPLNNENFAVAARVAPEDLRCGLVVAVLNQVYEFPSFFWCLDSQTNSPSDPVRIRWRSRDRGRPWTVEAICLPFVLLRDFNGRVRREDTRSTEFVRLDEKFVQAVHRVSKKKKSRKKGKAR
ncbi:hypothetical protein KOR42_31760 [Thalassoglobus neptunius]|uniref:Uncharacterized protein n=1 Tax=Thalassoglobus neptunius TaxID=1938619 RepID=A0A5C5WPI3_9PLAN|nr:hypothetical protein [Thalassoglobus neptunius]TWT52079.1 hypothetical protein KOR42_31760 [Thalassoglobus neptunius]